MRHQHEGFVFTQQGKRAASAYAGMFILLDGEVRVTAEKPDGGFAVDKRMGTGSAFGMIALLDDGPRSATVVATRDCTVAFLGRPGFLELYNAGLPVSARFQRLLAKQMAYDLRFLGTLLHEAIAGDDTRLKEYFTTV